MKHKQNKICNELMSDNVVCKLIVSIQYQNYEEIKNKIKT